MILYERLKLFRFNVVLVMQLKYYLWVLSLSLLVFTQGFGQLVESGELHGQVHHFRIKGGNEEIDFIKVDPSLKKKKPVLLFCQGSDPTPLFVDLGNGTKFLIGGGLSNIEYRKIAEDYHIIVISMPSTPVTVPVQKLDDAFRYVQDKSKPNNYTSEFIDNNYLDNYVDRGNAVLNYLMNQKWVDETKIVVFGHSQGSKVAAKIAVSNPNVTHLGLFGANPNGRIDQMIREQRDAAEKGKITWEKAEENIAYWENLWKDINNPDSLAIHPEYKAWKTFSEPFIDDWLRLEMPVYLCYGTNDIVADLCDVVKLEFIKKGKDNLTVKRQHNLDHNFFEQPPNAKKIAHWKPVMTEFLKWVDYSNQE